MVDSLYYGLHSTPSFCLHYSRFSAFCKIYIFLSSIHIAVAGWLFYDEIKGEVLYDTKGIHDPFERATSAGPLTSKFMTEALQKKAESLSIKMFGGHIGKTKTSIRRNL